MPSSRRVIAQRPRQLRSGLASTFHDIAVAGGLGSSPYDVVQAHDSGPPSSTPFPPGIVTLGNLHGTLDGPSDQDPTVVFFVGKLSTAFNTPYLKRTSRVADLTLTPANTFKSVLSVTFTSSDAGLWLVVGNVLTRDTVAHHVTSFLSVDGTTPLASTEQGSAQVATLWWDNALTALLTVPTAGTTLTWWSASTSAATVAKAAGLTAADDGQPTTMQCYRIA